ncbi:MAG: Rpp14/Pop5 family protein [Nanoarchaeota archaeon]|nr:hypothetical protein [Nanoarchaeota archaeon]MBU4300213.1 hypothetical protein [Nanoarchaeota archaeon]MBU4451599.1 hypothetical protein [Nanoarchaeota archaeon]MCG2723121.1 hypothetical protein [archaeon]
MNGIRLNTLPPTLRENARYLVFEIISKKDFDIAEAVDALWQNSLMLFGETGASKFSLWVPFNLYDREKKRGIVKCAHTSVEEVRSAIAAIKQIGNEPAIMHVLGVTGTILSAKKKFFGIVDLKAFQKEQIQA